MAVDKTPPRRPLLAGGEKLKTPADRSPGGGPKFHPVTIDEAYRALGPQAVALAKDVKALPEDVCGKHVVFEATIHPNYIANAYHPGGVLARSNFYVVGARRASAPYKTKTKETVAPTKSLLIAGDRNGIEDAASLPSARASICMLACASPRATTSGANVWPLRRRQAPHDDLARADGEARGAGSTAAVPTGPLSWGARAARARSLTVRFRLGRASARCLSWPIHALRLGLAKGATQLRVRTVVSEDQVKPSCSPVRVGSGQEDDLRRRDRNHRDAESLQDPFTITGSERGRCARSVVQRCWMHPDCGGHRPEGATPIAGLAEFLQKHDDVPDFP